MCPLIEPDFSENLDGIPEGTYQANIVDSEVKEAKSSGNKYVKWQLTIVNATDSRINGKAVWTNTPINGKGVFRLQQLYKAATGNRLTQGFDTTELMGKTVLIDVIDGVDRATGEKSGYSEVKAVKPLH